MDEGLGVTLEVASKGGRVVLALHGLGPGLYCGFELTPDEARELSNSIGAAILAASRAGVVT